MWILREQKHSNNSMYLSTCFYEVLLELNHAHLLICHLWLLLCHKQPSWVAATETIWPTKLKIFTTSPYTEKNLTNPHSSACIIKPSSLSYSIVSSKLFSILKTNFIRISVVMSNQLWRVSHSLNTEIALWDNFHIFLQSSLFWQMNLWKIPTI